MSNGRANHPSSLDKNIGSDGDLVVTTQTIPNRETSAAASALDGAFIQLSEDEESQGRIVRLHSVHFSGGRPISYKCGSLSSDPPVKILKQASSRIELFSHNDSPYAVDRQGNLHKIHADACSSELLQAPDCVPLLPRAVVVPKQQQCHLLSRGSPTYHLNVDADGLHQRRLLSDHYGSHVVDFGASSCALSLVMRSGSQYLMRVYALDGSRGEVWLVNGVPENAELRVINAFEQDDAVIVDVVETRPRLDRLQSSRLVRWQARQGQQYAIRKPFRGSFHHLAIDRRFVGRECPFVVCTAFHTRPDALGNWVLTLGQLESGTTHTHDCGFGRRPSEPVIVSRSDASGDRAGWLLVLIYDAVHDCSDLVVFDLEHFSNEAFLRIRLPQPIRAPGPGLWCAGSAQARLLG